jgi:(p)ppGpp synthase/HD superfamily hydrolase
MDLVNFADFFACAAHAAVKQTRKYTGEPYINHPREVREILLKFATGPVTLEQEAAALLHDVVEDTGVDLELIVTMFGNDVAVLVEGLTDVSKPEDGNRKLRKQKDLDHTAAAPVAAKSIKLADLISNSHSIVEHDPDFARVYLHEKTRILDVCSGADPGLLAEAYRVLNYSKEQLRPKSK